jgi:nitronate monooxygenase
MATKECKMHNNVKQELVKREEFETTLYGKTIELQGRALKNSVIKQVQELEARHAKLEEMAPLLMGARQVKIWDDGDVEAGMIPVGQSIGLIHDVISCKELMERMGKEAEDILKNKAKSLQIV